MSLKGPKLEKFKQRLLAKRKELISEVRGSSVGSLEANSDGIQDIAEITSDHNRSLRLPLDIPALKRGCPNPEYFRYILHKRAARRNIPYGCCHLKPIGIQKPEHNQCF